MPMPSGRLILSRGAQMANSTTATFADIARQFVSGLDTAYSHRSSDPLSTNTKRLYTRCAHRAAESLGSLPLAGINAHEVKRYIGELKRSGLADTSVVCHFQVLRSVVESVRDDTGNPVVPARFNLGWIGLPVIKADRLKAPIATVADIQKAIRVGGDFGCLIALLAGTGLRVSEALDLTLDGMGNRYDALKAEIIIISGKTDAAARTVPLYPSLNAQLAKMAQNRTGRLFRGSESLFRQLLRRYNLPAFHAYRRYRTTHLRRAGMTEEVIRYILGHARTSITDRYSRLTDDRQFIRTAVEKAGLGFDLA